LNRIVKATVIKIFARDRYSREENFLNKNKFILCSISRTHWQRFYDSPCIQFFSKLPVIQSVPYKMITSNWILCGNATKNSITRYNFIWDCPYWISMSDFCALMLVHVTFDGFLVRFEQRLVKRRTTGHLKYLKLDRNLLQSIFVCKSQPQWAKSPKNNLKECVFC